ncbi:unnamed protein product [Chrysoparadoxa australica]
MATTPSTQDTSRITLELLQGYYDLPLAEVSKELGVSLTVLKKICRGLGIERWPHRQMRSINKMMQDMKERAAGEITKEERQFVESEMNLLLKKKRMVTKGASFGLQAALRNALFLANPQDVEEEELFSNNVLPQLNKAMKPVHKVRRSQNPLVEMMQTIKGGEQLNDEDANREQSKELGSKQPAKVKEEVIRANKLNSGAGAGASSKQSTAEKQQADALAKSQHQHRLRFNPQTSGPVVPQATFSPHLGMAGTASATPLVPGTAAQQQQQEAGMSFVTNAQAQAAQAQFKQFNSQPTNIINLTNLQLNVHHQQIDRQMVYHDQLKQQNQEAMHMLQMKQNMEALMRANSFAPQPNVDAMLKELGVNDDMQISSDILQQFTAAAAAEAVPAPNLLPDAQQLRSGLGTSFEMPPQGVAFAPMFGQPMLNGPQPMMEQHTGGAMSMMEAMDYSATEDLPTGKGEPSS